MCEAVALLEPAAAQVPDLPPELAEALADLLAEALEADLLNDNVTPRYCLPL